MLIKLLPYAIRKRLYLRWRKRRTAEVSRWSQLASPEQAVEMVEEFNTEKLLKLQHYGLR